MIAFKHPEILFGLLAIAIPIIIHLFSFRTYKKVYFHSLQLIKNIQIEQNSTKSKLKELLLLISRIGLIACVVIVFAQPYIPNADSPQSHTSGAVAIYIDNSFSTQAESENGVVLEFEKKKAQEIVDAYPNDTRFFLFSNTANSTEQFSRTSEEVKNDISEIAPSPNKMLFSDVVKKMKLCQHKNETLLDCHILSDMQKQTFDIQTVQDSSLEITYYPFENGKPNNISIDSCYFENMQHIAGQTEKIMVKLSNNTDETFANFPIKLFINDTLRALSSATIKPHSIISVPIEYNISTTGIISGKLEIEDYPILYDNSYFFTYFIDKQINILNIYDKTPNKHISALCKRQENFALTQQPISSIDYSTIANYPIIILDALQSIPAGLNEEIKKLRTLGATIVCIPSENIDVNSYNTFLQNFGSQRITTKDTIKTAIETLDERNIIFKNVIDKSANYNSLPYITMHYKTENQRNNAIITLQDKEAFLTQTSAKNATLFFFNTPLSTTYGNFVVSPLFVVVYNMCMYVSSTNEIQTTIGNTSEISTAKLTTDDALHIVKPEKNIDIIPHYRNDIQTAKTIINPMNQITEAGNYTLTQKNAPISGLAYNYDRSESIFEFFTTEELQSFVSNTKKIIQPTHEITALLKETREGTPLWRIVLGAALFFLTCEICILLFFDKLLLKQKTNEKFAETGQKTTFVYE
ncbi:MAG: BatA domain-containing protein [Bacteroidales bacterium]|nr:BatA domain-containing protein [Bacteroidales bacterium]